MLLVDGTSVGVISYKTNPISNNIQMMNELEMHLIYHDVYAHIYNSIYNSIYNLKNLKSMPKPSKVPKV